MTKRWTKGTVMAALVAAGWAAPARAESCGDGPRVEQKPGAVAVQLPSGLAPLVPTDRPVRLTLSHGSLGETSVVGRARLAHKNVVEIVTPERLSYLPVAGTEIGFSDGSGSAASGCGGAESGIGCYLKGCIGTAYCLPGHGDGGFTCTCR
jgi:hypothetical protein